MSRKEFSRYGILSDIVKEMVDSDNKQYVTQFYTSLNNYLGSGITVLYVESFWDDFQRYKK